MLENTEEKYFENTCRSEYFGTHEKLMKNTTKIHGKIYCETPYWSLHLLLVGMKNLNIHKCKLGTVYFEALACRTSWDLLEPPAYHV
jgi:hypothetical protein